MHIDSDATLSSLDPATMAMLIAADPTLQGDLRSDHAGETGAVAIYRGILALSKDQAIRQFAEHHLATERGHLEKMDRLLPRDQRSLLLPLWRIAGWLTGFLPTLVGAHAVYATIDAVETFVDHHYEAQICKLPDHGAGGVLRALLQECQADEVHHRDEARMLGGPRAGALLRAWQWLVGKGSALAVNAAQRI